MGLDLESLRSKRKELQQARASLDKWKNKYGMMSLSPGAVEYMKKQERHIQELEQEVKNSWNTTVL